MALGPKMHARLCIIICLLWGCLFGLAPFNSFGWEGSSIFAFLCLYTLVAFYRWYMHRFSAKFGAALMVFGCVLELAVMAVKDWCAVKTGDPTFALEDMVLMDSMKLPVLFVAFGSFIIALNFEFSNRVINLFAGTTFGIYLIDTHPFVRIEIGRVFNLGTIYSSHFAPLYSLGMVLVLFIGMMIVDLLRKGIFKVTIDRHPGKIFDVLLTRLQKLRHTTFIRRQIRTSEFFVFNEVH